MTGETMSERWFNTFCAQLKRIRSSICVIERLSQLLEAILSKLDSLRQKSISLSIATVVNRGKLDGLEQDLKKAARAVNRYVERICDLYVYASNKEMIEQIKEEMESGDFTLLTKFITDLQDRYLKPADKSCEEAEEKLEAIRSTAVQLAVDCSKMRTDAKSRKSTSRLVGGTVVAAGGALALGAFTFGIGTLVGAGAVVLGLSVGSASGYATYVTSSEFSKNESELGELSKEFEGVKLSASHLLEFTRENKEYLETVTDKLNLINQAGEDHDVHSRKRLSLAFDRLCQKLSDLNTPMYKKKLNAIDEDFRQKVEKIFKGMREILSKHPNG